MPTPDKSSSIWTVTFIINWFILGTINGSLKNRDMLEYFAVEAHVQIVQNPS